MKLLTWKPDPRRRDADGGTGYSSAQEGTRDGVRGFQR
jgi:hypothetical protein